MRYVFTLKALVNGLSDWKSWLVAVLPSEPSQRHKAEDKAGADAKERRRRSADRAY